MPPMLALDASQNRLRKHPLGPGPAWGVAGCRGDKVPGSGVLHRVVLLLAVCVLAGVGMLTDGGCTGIGS